MKRKYLLPGLLILAAAREGLADQAGGKAAPPLPGMVQEQVFAGPLKDTVIQRLRDPQTGAVCYLYTPERVSYQRNNDGAIFYGPNAIGSISCFPTAATNRAH